MFSRIDPLIDEKRRDLAMRFVALIFLLHDGEVQATQYSSDIEIELPTMKLTEKDKEFIEKLRRLIEERDLKLS